MSAGTLLWVALGGAFGSVARAVTVIVLPAGRLPWGTIVVNVIGSFAIGWLMARLTPGSAEAMRAQGFLVVGVGGGFTTFSAFSWQTFEQMQKGQWGAAVGNVVLSVGVCLAATWLGWRLAR